MYRWDFKVTNEEMNSIIEDFGGDLIYPENFEQTVDVYNPSERNPPAAKVMVNPQSTLLCTMLDITDPNAVFLGQDSKYDIRNDENEDDVVDDENEDVDDDDTEYESFVSVADSDQSFSFLSSSNADDSILSLGVKINDSVDEKDSVVDIVNLNNSSVTDDDSDEEFKQIMEKQKIEQSIDKSSSSSKSSISQSDPDNSDSELKDIVSEQKAKRQLKLTSDTGHVELALVGSDDDELANLLAEQKRIQSIPDISVEDVPSLLSQDTLPLSQSSPVSSDERSDSEVVKATYGLALGEDKEGRKRSDGSESEESPQSKKLRRRNRSLYESNDEME